MATVQLQIMNCCKHGRWYDRRVFDPFKIQLRISQSAGHTAPTTPDTSPDKSKPGPAAKAQLSQGQEIRLVVPEIGVVMDSREFEVLTDVISNVGLAQVCHQHRIVIGELAAVARQH